MTPAELAAIVARDAEWTPPSIGEDEYAELDRRALLALLRETREALDRLHLGLALIDEALAAEP